MKHLSDDLMLKRLEIAAKKHIERDDHEEHTVRCPECMDTLFVDPFGTGFRQCQFGHCPAWDHVRAECDHVKASGAPRRRKVTKDDIPF